MLKQYLRDYYFRCSYTYIVFKSGFRSLKHAYIAWYKHITNTQDDFSAISMDSREFFFFILTGIRKSNLIL